MTRPIRVLSVATLLLALPGLAIVAGCGDSGPPMGTVTGKVTVDGQPSPDGTIAFVPLDGMSPTAGGKIEGGAYSAKVPLGPSRVEIRVSKVVGQRKAYNTPDSPTLPVMEEMLPGKYNDYSELEFDVQKGTNERNFELLTK